MAASIEGHSRPETGPPGGLVDLLARWETQGGLWRILNETEDWLTIGLLSCDGGERMSRVTGTRTTVLAAFLRGRTASSE